MAEKPTEQEVVTTTASVESAEASTVVVEKEAVETEVKEEGDAMHGGETADNEAREHDIQQKLEKIKDSIPSADKKELIAAIAAAPAAEGEKKEEGVNAGGGGGSLFWGGVKNGFKFLGKAFLFGLTLAVAAGSTMLEKILKIDLSKLGKAGGGGGHGGGGNGHGKSKGGGGGHGGGHAPAKSHGGGGGHGGGHH